MDICCWTHRHNSKASPTRQWRALCEDLLCVAREKEVDYGYEKKCTPPPPHHNRSPVVSNASSPEFPFKLCSWEQSPVSDTSSAGFELDISVVEERLAFQVLLEEHENMNA